MRLPVTDIPRFLVIIMCIGIIVGGGLAGVRWVINGITYYEFDAISAHEMLNLIEKTNPNHYEKIINPSDSTYRKLLESNFTTRSDITTIALGLVTILFSVSLSANLLMSATVLQYLKDIRVKMSLGTTQNVTPEVTPESDTNQLDMSTAEENVVNLQYTAEEVEPQTEEEEAT